ncbi:MAG TPA: cysteine dioxygenase family protein [Candidatus Limnocylindria bacterium]|nr:cysteine dioxygenase family protein [Candidatus Limnocylindria bacterium]
MAQETATVTSIHDLAGRIRDASAPGSGPNPEQVRAILSEALATPGDWIDPAYQHLGEGEYALYPVYRAEDGRCSMLVAVLRSGTPLPVHNHGSWAVIGVYKGREHETWFRRVDDGSVPGRAQVEVDQTFENERGTASVVPDGRIHTVEAMDGQQAVSIHVYGTDIVTQQRSEFDPLTGTERVFRPPFAEADTADQAG